MAPTPTIVRFGGYQPPASVHTRGAQAFGEHLSRALGAAVRFELTGNVIDRGRPARDLLAMVETGELDLCYFSASYLAERVPEMALLDLPFTFDDRVGVYGILDGPLGAFLADRIKATTGYRLLGFWDNGFRHFSNSVRPIRQPEDCRGLRIRTLFSDAHQEVFRALGFDPVALDVKDLLAGIEDGTVVAQENPLTNYFNFDIHLKHRYITLSAHFFGAAALLCNAESLERWPEIVRAAVLDSAAAATAEQRRLAGAEDDEILRKLSDTDVEIVELDDAERQGFAEAVRPLIEAQRARFGDDLFRHLV
jgi:C4-dicarboxylate-binding protein DctP